MALLVMAFVCLIRVALSDDLTRLPPHPAQWQQGAQRAFASEMTCATAPGYICFSWEVGAAEAGTGIH
jgi:hypothetical protein